MSGAENSVDRLVLQFSGLRITIEQGEASASAREPSPTGSFILVEGDSAGSQTETGPLARGSQASPSRAGSSPDEAFLDATTLAALGALELGPLARFARGLASVGDWSPAARVARAYRAGLSAKSVLEGRTDYQASSLPVPTRNRIYVVLRCRAEPEGFVTDNFRTFLGRVPKDQVGRLEKFAVCHAFASRSEASAFIEDIEALMDGAPPERPLPMYYFLDNPDNPTMRITAFIVRLRAGGFMVAMPGTDEVGELLSNLSETGDPAAPLLFTPLQVACETPRRRALGEITLHFVDIPWAWLGFLRSGAALRGSTLELVCIKVDGVTARPNSDGARAAADLWVATAIEDPELQDSGSLPKKKGNDEEQADAGELSRLRARLHALEMAAGSGPLAGGGISSLAGRATGSQTRRGARDLFPADRETALTEADLRALRAAAGPAPLRLAQHERAPRPALTREADDTLAELEAGVSAEEFPGGSSGDAVLQRLLLVQTQMLAKLSAGKPKSPLEAALVSGGAKDDGNLSAKGSAARDAFVRILKDSQLVADQIRRLAAEELGEDAANPPPSLMRTFVEKRSPVGELRTLALVSTFAAHGWEHARTTENVDLEAWCARLLMFTDQCAMESGRTQLGWLLTGLPDPSWGTLVRRRQGLRPFSRLCPSLWLSGNVAFLKEMEWLSTRMSAATDQGREPPKDAAETEEQPSGRPPRFFEPCWGEALSGAGGAEKAMSGLSLCLWRVGRPMQNANLARGCGQLPPMPLVHASRSELLRLAGKWDQFKATLPSSAHVMRVCCDDLSEMYYTFHVPEKRAKRNCLGMVFSPSELCGFNAYDPSRHYGPCYIALGALAMGDCGAVEYAQQSHFNVLSSLGNCMRPNEFVAYRRAFPRSSCLEFLSIDDHMTAQVCSRMQLKLHRPLRDTAIFECSDAAYPAVGLVSHPGKRKRNTTSGVFLGAELDGIEGIVSAPRHRIGVLMKVTSLIARRACASASLLASVLGLWVHALLFRRPVFSVLSQVFVDARRVPANEVFTLHRDTVNELFALCALAPLLQADLRVTYPGALYTMDASPTGAGLCSAVLPPHVVQELWRHSEQKGFYTRLLDPAAALLCDLGLSSDAGSAFVEGLTSPSVSPFDPEPLPLRAPRCGDTFFLCLFCESGNWASSFSRAGLVDFSVAEPWLSGLPFSALGDVPTFRRLCVLACSGRVHDWHVGPSWDVSGRSEADPCGFHSGFCDLPAVASWARRLGFLLCLAASAGSYVSLVQPPTSTLFRLHCFRGFVSYGAALTKLHLCAFGSPCCQAVDFLHNKPWLCKLGGSRCGCSSDSSAARFPAVGRFTAASSCAFTSLCRPSAAVLFGREPVCGERVADFCSLLPLPLVAQAASGSSLAATGYSELRYKFKGPGHINVLEARAYKTWLKEPPASSGFKVVAPLAVVRGRWLRLLLLLAGDVERNPGPFHDGAPRGALDLQGGFASSTRHKMDKALSAFQVWLRGSFGLELEAVLSSVSSTALALRAFGLYLYSSGQPRYLLVYAITSVQDSHPQFRSQLAPAWQVDRKWQQAEPGECRPVISQPIVQASVALALCWGWHDWACLTLIGFLCMLHPAEMLCLTRQDLVFPEDALSPDPVAYVHIRSPKTHRFARRQHSRLEDPLVLRMLQALYLDLPLASRLFRGSMHTYRRQWNSVMSRLGVPHRLSERGATPGVLRGSGATFLYLETEDLPLVAWNVAKAKDDGDGKSDSAAFAFASTS
ncbi:hypothetical protein AK812_SmicGene45344, partial [Symbiodinium microadriaticum]